MATPSHSSSSAPSIHLQRYDHLYKIILVGDPSVGKTNLTIRFCENVFGNQYVGTIGIDFKVRTVEVDGKKIKLQIWDTAGQERFQVITQVYYRGSHGVMFVFDISDHFTFEHIRNWMQSFDEVTGCETKKMIVGNKADKFNDRQVQYHEAEMVADTYNCRYIETSAKTAHNVDNAFLMLAKDIKDYQTTHPRMVNRGIRLQNDKIKAGLNRKKGKFFSKCNVL